MPLFIIKAYRYGFDEYTFLVGVFSTRRLAIEAATEHREARGGKYDHRLFEVQLGHSYDAEECKGVWVTGSSATI